MSIEPANPFSAPMASTNPPAEPPSRYRFPFYLVLWILGAFQILLLVFVEAYFGVYPDFAPRVMWIIGLLMTAYASFAGPLRTGWRVAAFLLALFLLCVQFVGWGLLHWLLQGMAAP